MALNFKQLRIDNQLSQLELGKFLGISRGFVSLIEMGNAKLPDEKIDKIFDEAEKKNGWNIINFNPDYTRLTKIVTELSRRGKYITLIDNLGNNPFEINNATILRIKHGKQELNQTLVDFICEKFPDINGKWLLLGEMPMFLHEREYNEIGEDGIPFNPPSPKITLDDILFELKRLNDNIEAIKSKFGL